MSWTPQSWRSLPIRQQPDYDDPEAVAAQLATMREEVLKYRDHPAVLAWLIGNELKEEGIDTGRGGKFNSA